jgi:DNA-binding SARP family transcriptional activator
VAAGTEVWNTPLVAEPTAVAPAPGQPGTVGLSVCVLGGLRVSVDGIPVDVRGTLRRRLVLTLVAGGERGVSVDAIAEALWPDGPRREGTANAVQAHVSRLRRLLAPEPALAAARLVSRSDGYLLRPDQLDLADLEGRIAGAEAMSVADPLAAFAEFNRALAQWLPPVEEDLSGWNELVRRLQHRMLGAEDMWADLAVRLGATGDADQILDLARAQPTRETRWCLAMRALAGAGRQVEALEGYAAARHTLLEDYGLEPGRELRLTQEAVLRQDLHLHRRADRPTTGLAARLPPRPVTSFVGRAAEFDRLERLVAGSRLITLVGLGGVGKSRLLGEWVHRSGRAGSSVWVDLRGVASTELITRVADDLGLVPGGIEPDHVLDTIVAATSALPTLLLLDNADEVVSDVAELVSDLLGRLPQLVVLTTSRSPLGLPGERVMALAPLAVDPVDLGSADNSGGGNGMAGAHNTGAADAVTLAASRLDPGATPEVAREVARRSGGLPLAIELIAASGIDGPPPGSASELGLERITDTVLEELAPDSGQLLRALLVLPAGAPASLVETLTRGIDGPPARRQRLLRELVGTSLVTSVPDHSATGGSMIRYRVLQPIMDAQSGRVDAAARDAAYQGVGAWVDARLRVDSFAVTNEAGQLELLDELATIRRVLTWWCARDPRRFFQATLRMSDFWRWAGRAQEGKDLLRQALALHEPEPEERADALVQLSLGSGLGTMAAELPMIEQALSILREAGISEGPVYATAQGVRAVGLGWRGDLTGFEEASAAARMAGPADLGSPFYLNLDQAIALSWVLRGDPARGIPLARGTAQKFADLGDSNAAAVSMHFAANLARLAGRDPGPEFDIGDRIAEQALPHVRALLAGERARHALVKGQADAVDLLVEAIRLTERTGNLRTAAVGRRELGLHHLRHGDRVAARYELTLAAHRLGRLHRGESALALAGLAALEDGPTHRTDLAAAAWALALAPDGVPLGPLERTRLSTLVGPPPDPLPELEEAMRVLKAEAPGGDIDPDRVGQR